MSSFLKSNFGCACRQQQYTVDTSSIFGCGCRSIEAEKPSFNFRRVAFGANKLIEKIF